MTPAQIALLFSPDTNLSPEARSIVAFVSTVSDTEIPFWRLMRLAHIRDEKKLRRAIVEAEDAGWLVVTRNTGRDHHPRFGFRVPENGSLKSDTLPKNGTLSDSPPENGSLRADRVPENGSLNGASTTTTTSTTSVPTPTGARPSDQDLDRLALYLGEHASAVHQMLDSANHPPNWVAAVMGKYGPSGAQLRLLSGIPPERRHAVVATALMEWATTGKPFTNRHFDGFIRKAAENERRGGSEGGNGGGTGSEAGRPALRAVGGGRRAWDIEE